MACKRSTAQISLSAISINALCFTAFATASFTGVRHMHTHLLATLMMTSGVCCLETLHRFQ